MSDATRKFARYATPANSPVGYVCRTVRIPDDLNIIAAVNEVLGDLTRPEIWESQGGLTPEETAFLTAQMWVEYVESRCMLGAIFPYVTAAPPSHCIPCDGSSFNRADYPRLWDVLDLIFKVDASTFVTPDLRGRTVVGAGQGSGLSARATGDVGGAETVALEVRHMPAHSHTSLPHDHGTVPHTHPEGIAVPSIAAVLPPPDTVPSAVPGVGEVLPVGVSVLPATVTVESTGGEQAHDNMPPFLALKYCMVAE